jgi:glutamyl-Q tRNA(Asp) synthetase
MGYRGRFAPSPTGPLHAGSLVAALASWLDARAHGGAWLVRIEDIDTPRCVPGAEARILAQLAACGLHADEPPWRQSRRGAAYGAALQQLLHSGAAYPCACTRSEIDAVLAERGQRHDRFAERVYPGTCRNGLQGRPARAMRLRAEGVVDWCDRRLGRQRQGVGREVGDFVLRRADGLWAYQLVVVVDDAAQGITDVVRGADLADNTARQILLQRALGVATPRYLHTPLVRGADGHKLSKQNGAQALDLADPLATLRAAAAVLGLPALAAGTVVQWLTQAVPAWAGMMRALVPLEPPMTTLPSGLQFEDTTPGTGTAAAAGHRVRVHYTGWLHDPTAKNNRGRKFDSSKDRGQPFAFSLGEGEVIRGWDEGVAGMLVGGTRVLTIPPELGYGARGAGGVIPPHATLVFEVDLLGV